MSVPGWTDTSRSAPEWLPPPAVPPEPRAPGMVAPWALQTAPPLRAAEEAERTVRAPQAAEEAQQRLEAAGPAPR